MPASTTNAKTLTPAAVTKAANQVRTRILRDMADSSFLAPTDLVTKLFIKYLKEELKL